MGEKQNITLPVKFVIYLPGWRDALQRHPVSSTYQRRSRRPCSASVIIIIEITLMGKWETIGQVEPGNQLRTASTWGLNHNFRLVLIAVGVNWLQLSSNSFLFIIGGVLNIIIDSSLSIE